MPALTDDQLKVITDQEMRNAIGGYMGGKLSEARRKAEYYYLGLAKGDLAAPEIDGRSTFVDTTVRNQIEWMVPSLMKTFCSGDNVVEFEPQKEGDEDKAKQATDYINYLFYKKNNGYTVLQTAIRDALLQKAGVGKVWWDNRDIETREEYKALSDIDLAQLMDDEEIEPIEQTSYPDEEDAEQRQQAVTQIQQQLQQAQQAAQSNPQAAQAVQAMTAQLQQLESMPPKMLYDVTFKRTKKGGKICVENVPPEEFLISRKAKTIADAPFVAHRVMRTISDLTAMGYKNVDQISSDDTQGAYSAERIERASWDDDTPYLNQDDASIDPTMRIVWVTECYLRVDVDGDGIAEWRKVVRSGNQILENEECDGPPFFALIPIILPHRFFGLSIADLGLEPQKLQTQLVRSVIDNQFLQVNGRYFAVEGQVNLDDLLTSRPGGVVRVKSPQAAGRLDQGQGNTGESMQMLEWMQDFTENATGWTRRSQGTGPTSLQQQTATGMNIVTNRDDMRLDLIARNFAEGGITDLFKLMLKLVCQYQDKKDVISVSGQWVEIDPREWKNQFSLNISVGLGTNNKDQQAQHLMGLLGIQQQALQIGVCTPQNIYNSAVLYAQAMGQKSGDKFFTDPSKQPPQPPQPNPEMVKIQGMQQLEMQKHQMQMEQRDKELQQEAMIRERELQLEAQKQQLQAQADMAERQHEAELTAQLEQQKMAFEQWKTQLENETKVVVAELQAKTQLHTASISANASKGAETLTEVNPDGNEQPTSALTALVDSVNANMAQLISNQQQSHAELVAAMTRPKQIIRGPDGRAQGVA